MVAFWDMEELICTGTLSFNDYQVRRLAYNNTGELLGAICYDEILKKWQLEIYENYTRQLVTVPVSSTGSKTAVVWHPVQSNVIAWSGEVEKDVAGPGLI